MAKRAGKSSSSSLKPVVDSPLEPAPRGWMDAISAPVLLLSPAAQILHSNQTCQQLTGYSAADLDHKYLWECPPAAEQDQAKQDLRALANYKAPPPLELAWVLNTGEILRVAWTFKPLSAAAEGGVTWVATGHCGLEQDRTAAEAILHSLMVGTAMATGEDFFAAFVEQVGQALGVSYALVSELVDDRLQTLAFWSQGQLQPNFSYPYLDTPCQLSLQQGVYACPVAVQQSFPKDLDLGLMEAESYLGIAIQNPRGETLGTLCLVDTKPLVKVERMETILRIFATRAAAELERQRATQTLEAQNQTIEQALQESQTLLQLVLDTLPLSIFWKDRHCIYLGCNKQMLADAGLTTLTDMIGKTDFDLPWRHEAKLYRADDLEVMATGQPKLNIEEPITKSGNVYGWLRTTKIPLRNPGGEIIGVLGAYEDITDRKQIEAQLRQSNENLALANLDLARATRLKDEFLAHMSHELRTPLSSILGMTQALSREVYGPMTERQHRSLNIVERSGRHLLTLINDILEVAKIEAGKISLQMGEFSVLKLCEDSLEFVQQQALQKHIHVTLKFSPEVTTLQGGELRLKQALINLLDNAMKFTPEGGQVYLEAGLETYPGHSHSSEAPAPGLALAVTDTGIGIAPEDQSRLFNTFVQLDSSLNRQYFGTGLGLALVKRIMDLHGGIVAVHSNLNQGSRFTLHFPPHLVIPFQGGNAGVDGD